MNASVRQSLARLALRRQPIHSKRFASSSEAEQKKGPDALAAAQKISGKVFESAKKCLEPVSKQAGLLFGCVFIIFLCLNIAVSVDASPPFFWVR